MFKYKLYRGELHSRDKQEETKKLMNLIIVFLVLVVLWALFHVLRSNSGYRRSAKLAPGPYPFPIIGNILQMGRIPHLTLAKLSKTYGPLMSLHLGSMYTVVVTSHEMAKKILQKNDVVFSSRTIQSAAQVHDHHNKSMAFLPVGSQWNKIRRICREQLFSIQCLEASQGLRQEKLRQLCDYVQECCHSGQVVDIGKVAFTTTLNLMSVTLFSVDFSNYGRSDSDSINEWEQAVKGVMNVIGVPNLADFFPVLKLVDPQGLKRQADFYFGKLLGMFEDLINQRLESRITFPKKKDLLEILLDSSQESEYQNLSCLDIKHLLLDLTVGGSDTTATTIEWTMTELLRNPKTMAIAKDELKTVLGGNKQANESDILKLPYLQAIIEEIYRLHPLGNLFPRKSEKDTQISGYLIPKNTQVLINVWAMGRDSSLWSNPDSFEPERHLDNKVDFKGQDFKLFPFGSGRRICPGMPLAKRMLPLVVAYLIHNFDWEIQPGKQTEIDIGEKFGLALHRPPPLKALPIKR